LLALKALLLFLAREDFRYCDSRGTQLHVLAGEQVAVSARPKRGIREVFEGGPDRQDFGDDDVVSISDRALDILTPLARRSGESWVLFSVPTPILL
jgi:hypothetical protein